MKYLIVSSLVVAMACVDYVELVDVRESGAHPLKIQEVRAIESWYARVDRCTSRLAEHSPSTDIGWSRWCLMGYRPAREDMCEGYGPATWVSLKDPRDWCELHTRYWEPRTYKAKDPR